MSGSAARRHREQPFFADIGSERLFAFLHRPEGRHRGVVVLCHALAEEKLWSHRVYVTFARELATLGYTVLRFDVRGEGDSDRDFEASSIETRIEDTLRAVDVALELGAPHAAVTLVGHRFGASIAAAAAAKLGDRLRTVVAWDPILDGEEYFGTLLRSNMATQMATAGKVTRTRDALLEAMRGGEIIVADGFGLNAQLFDGMRALQWPTLAGAFAQPLLLLEVPKGEQAAPSQALVQIVEARKSSSVQLTAEPPFWRETRQFHRRAAQFTAASIAWLNEHHSPDGE